MTTRRLKVWTRVHKWASLTCTLFLLVLCVTGLPLLFADEINGWLDQSTAYADVAADAPRASIDPMVAMAQRLRPHEVIIGIYLNPDEPEVRINTAVSQAAAEASPNNLHWLKFDAHTGRLLGDSARATMPSNAVEQFFFDIHTRLLLGLPGLILITIMGLFFLAALVSGAVLYAPFMRNLAFGTVRRTRSVRVRRLDGHNLFGIAVFAWASVVGFSGVLNELNDPLFDHWAQHVVAGAGAHWNGPPIAPGASPASVQAALDTARRATPDMIATGIDFPGASLNSGRHYMIWTRGKTIATAQLFTPVMVDAVNGRLTAILPMPWYLRAVEISRPFHFGDYGGLPLKLIWAVFDLATIFVLITGVQLWLRPLKGLHA